MDRNKFSKSHKGAFVIIYSITLSLLIVITILLFKSYKNSKKHYTFGATYMTMDNQYFIALNSKMEEIIDANGDSLITRDPAQSQLKQNQQIIDMLNEGVDLLFINPVDWSSITPALLECRDRGVPIINVDTNVFAKQFVETIILSDNYGAGVQIAYDIMKKKKNPRIVIMNHEGIYSTSQRIKGLLDTFDENNYKYDIIFRGYSSSTLNDSMVNMQKFLDEDSSEFDVVVGGNDPTALGALAAIQKAKIDNDILIYGIDGSPDAKAMINKGYMEGTSAQFPLKMAQQSVERAYKVLNNEEIEPLIYVPVELITKDNIDNFDITGWQ
ncbi:MAG: sugar ABC transporter substrate-binding protein [Sphaerochaetaceae bacterium]|nr:sugar ABC transporter substrate-binding protein [Sphaerochaetaceae bacterium]